MGRRGDILEFTCRLRNLQGAGEALLIEWEEALNGEAVQVAVGREKEEIGEA